MQQECKHEYVYQGAVNFFKNQELLLVIESWICRRCGLQRLGKRGPDYLSSTEGIYPPPRADKKWYVLACMVDEKPFIEAYQLSLGDEIPHSCSMLGEGERLVLDKDEKMRVGADGPVPSRHFLFKYDDIVKGYVELGKTPPEIITLARKEHI